MVFQVSNAVPRPKVTEFESSHHSTAAAPPGPETDYSQYWQSYNQYWSQMAAYSAPNYYDPSAYYAA